MQVFTLFADGGWFQDSIIQPAVEQARDQALATAWALALAFLKSWGGYILVGYILFKLVTQALWAKAVA